MNESSQIAAMAAELRSEGYNVSLNVRAGSLEDSPLVRLGTFVIDIVATRPLRFAPAHVETLLVEIANRRNRPDMNQTSRRLTPPQLLSEEEAVSRFKQLGDAVGESSSTALEIRFLDVSADQAAARRLDHARITRLDVEAAVREDFALWRSISDQPAQVRAAVLARLWSRALRLTAWRYPGRKRQELKYADLRTIQKDLYDYKILNLPPDRYQKAHLAVMAVAEGGALPCDHLLALESELKALWRWAADHLELKAERLMPAETTDFFDQLRQEARDRVPPGRLEAFETSLALMKLYQSHEGFPALVAQLHRDFDLRTLSDDAFDRLMAMLSGSP